MHVPVAASTPTGTNVHVHSSQQEDSYQQIIPGIPQGSLYPTLSSLSSGEGASNNEVQSLSDKMLKGLDKYLQDAEQHRVLEVNYFDDIISPTNIDSMSEAAEQINESSKNNLPSTKQETREEVESEMNIPESQNIDTGQIQMKSVNNVCHQNMLNKMQMHIRRMRNSHPKMWQQSPLQFTQTSYLQYFLLLMSLHQLKR